MYTPDRVFLSDLKKLDPKLGEEIPNTEESKEKKRIKNLFAFIFPYFPMIQI